MSTYSEIQAQIAELQKQAEAARQNELLDAIAQIESIMAQYGVTLEDIRGNARNERKVSSVKAKYRDPVTGKEWSGRGIAPRWIRESGKDKAAFLIQ